jgi:hypothetical protein
MAVKLACVLSLGAALVAFGVGVAEGAGVNVTIHGGPGLMYAERAGLSVPEIEMQIKNELERLFQVTRAGDYVRSWGDAQSFASRGMGADYASNFSAVMIGIAGNLSLNVEDAFVPTDTRTAPPAGGVSPNATILAGLNLAAFGLPPITVYGNWFEREGHIDEFGADLRNWGVHFQYKLFGPDEDSGLLAKLFTWGGLDITTGLEQSRLILSLDRAFKRAIPLQSASLPPGTTAFVNVDSLGSFTLDMRMLNIPLEVTTSLRLLYALSIYGGFGIDWQVGGGSDLVVDLDGTMTGVVQQQGGQPMNLDIGTAAVELTESAGPSKGRLRWLVGAQVNLFLLKLFAQLNLAAQDPVLASVALGARVAY